MSREVETWAREQKTGDPVRKAVLVALGNYADPHGRNCYPSIPRVAEEVEVSVRTVQRHLKTLEEMHLVKRVERLRDDGSLSSNLFTFPTYTAPKLSHKEPPKPAGGGGDNLTPGGDNLSPAGDAAVTGVVTMVSPHETPTESFPPTAVDKSPAVPPQGGLRLDLNDEEEGREEPETPRSKRGTRLPDDWTPPPVDDLPPATQAVVRQWPAGAYEFAADGFKAHWQGESGARASKLDWNAAWTKWLAGESSRIMGMARNGIAFASVQRETTHKTEFADVERRRQSECGKAAAMRKMLRADLGERTYAGWWSATSIGIARDGGGWVVNVVTPTRFVADWMGSHFLPLIIAMAKKVLQTDDVLVHIEAVGER